MDRETANSIVRDEHADPALLAQVAHEVPELRAAVAAHPAAYPGLLDWLGQLGDPAIDAVLRARTSPPATETLSPPPPPPPSVPSPTAALGGSPIPPPPSTPTRSGSRRWLFAVGAVVVVALGLGGTALALRDDASTASATTSTLLPYPTAPSATWTLRSGDFADAERDLEALLFTTSHIVVSATRGDDLVLAGYDRTTRAIDWQQDIGPAPAACRAHPDSTTVFCFARGEVSTFDASTGETSGPVSVYSESVDFSEFTAEDPFGFELFAHSDGTATSVVESPTSRTAPAEITRLGPTGAVLWSFDLEPEGEVTYWSFEEDPRSTTIVATTEGTDYRLVSWLVDDGAAEKLPARDFVPEHRGRYVIVTDYASENGATEVYDEDGQLVFETQGASVIPWSLDDWATERPLITFRSEAVAEGESGEVARAEIEGWLPDEEAPSWRYETDSRSLVWLLTDELVFLQTAESVVALNRADGTQINSAPHDGVRGLRTDGERLFLLDATGLTVSDLETGQFAWRVEMEGDGFSTLLTRTDVLAISMGPAITIYEP